MKTCLSGREALMTIFFSFTEESLHDQGQEV